MKISREENFAKFHSQWILFSREENFAQNKIRENSDAPFDIRIDTVVELAGEATDQLRLLLLFK